ncbi:MAG: hypothetical protein J5517_03950 [Eubacterium sp.]|nr:hypothetical protein [Eubacterium sp.]
MEKNNKKTIAIILELIPLVSLAISFGLIFSSIESIAVKWIINVTTFIAFLGFIFFFIGRKLAKGDKAVKILGILDIIAPVIVIALYVAAIFAFGL